MTDTKEVGALLLLQNSPNLAMLLLLVIQGKDFDSRFVAIHPFDHGGISLFAE
jgi:hypothetical protein